ncbi:MAG TPA: hypothetical protein VM491_24175, partial [Burkholderiaceae bacterium]|nr:hypothetical protein [Burkholderiaceae bacterium]
MIRCTAASPPARARPPIHAIDPAAFVLATSKPFDATYLVANEEILVSRPTITGELSPSVRSDVVLQHLRSGGAVFSAGSIAGAAV